jgi:hypothetical protein
VLFTDFFRLIRQAFTAQRSIPFVFDDKLAIANHARTIHEVFNPVRRSRAPMSSRARSRSRITAAPAAAASG